MSIDPVSIAITIALNAAAYAMQASKKIEGPRLDNLNISIADYGTPLNYFYGIRRLEGVPIIWTTPLVEIQTRRKTKGGKYNEYTYYANFAVAVAGHEIGGITRIWLDRHLAYDVSGAGPISIFSEELNFNIQDYIRIYTGTSTQEIDPLIELHVDAIHGAGSTTAMRDVSYIVFEGLPVEKFGNRVPQITIEAVSVLADRFPFETSPAQNNNRMWNTTYSTDFTRLRWRDQTWDVPSRTKLIEAPFPVAINLTSRLGMFKNGTIYAVSSDRQKTYSIQPDGIALKTSVEFPTGIVCHHASTGSGFTYQEEVRVLADGNGDEHWMTTPYSTFTNFIVNGSVFVPLDVYGVTFGMCDYFTDAYGDIWGCGRFWGHTQTTAHFVRIVNTSQISRPAIITVTGLVQNGGTLGRLQAVHYKDDNVDHIVFAWGNHSLYALDINTGLITIYQPTSMSVYNGPKQFANFAPGRNSVWLNNSEVSLATLQQIRAVDLSDWTAADASGILYDPLNHALITWPQFDQEVCWRYLDRIGSDGVVLSSIVSDVNLRCGGPPALINTSALDQVVKGYSWVRGSGKDIIDPLLRAYDSYVASRGFTLYFGKRGSAAAGTINSKNALASGDRRFTIDTKLDTDLPSKVTFSYADINADQQPNVAADQIRSDETDSVNEITVNLSTLALEATEAQQYLERFFRRVIFAAESYSLVLNSQNLALEVGDVKSLTLGELSRTSFIQQITYSQDTALSISFERDHPSIAVLSGTAGQEVDGRVEEVIDVPTISKTLVVDTPYHTDAHDQVTPILYLGAGPYGNGTWPGAVLYEEVAADDYTELQELTTSQKTVWGYTSTVLGQPFSPWVWDRGNSVTVLLVHGTLTSATEAQCEGDDTLNLAYINGELVQFTTPTLVSGTTWTISGFRRARRGTEVFMSNHAAGQVFCMVSTLSRETKGLSDIATVETYRAATSGRGVDSAFPEEITYQGNSLRPYAPCDLTAARDGTNDWDITWRRRTRLGGNWTGGAAIPLGESSEAYKIIILNGTTEVRTIDTVVESGTYTSAQQTTDFGGVLNTLRCKVVQMNPTAALRGFEALLVIDAAGVDVSRVLNESGDYILKEDGSLIEFE